MAFRVLRDAGIPCILAYEPGSRDSFLHDSKVDNAGGRCGACRAAALVRDQDANLRTAVRAHLQLDGVYRVGEDIDGFVPGGSTANRRQMPVADQHAWVLPTDCYRLAAGAYPGETVASLYRLDAPWGRHADGSPVVVIQSYLGHPFYEARRVACVIRDPMADALDTGGDT